MGKKMKRKKSHLKFEIHCSQWILKIATINQFKRFDRRDFKTYKECYIVGSMTAQLLCYMHIPIISQYARCAHKSNQMNYSQLTTIKKTNKKNKKRREEKTANHSCLRSWNKKKKKKEKNREHTTINMYKHKNDVHKKWKENQNQNVNKSENGLKKCTSILD